jgi:holin-like protein
LISGFSIIFTCLLVGEAIATFLHVPSPGNVIGMVLLTASLAIGLVRLDDVKPVADILLKHLALLFVPPGVGILLYGNLLKQEWLSISLAVTLSTILVLAIVGLLQQRLEKHHE